MQRIKERRTKHKDLRPFYAFRRFHALRPEARVYPAHGARIFAEKGYHSTSMRDISRETKVSLSGLYHYCKSKEELLFLIQDNCFGRVLERSKQRLQETDRADREATSRHRKSSLVFRGEHGGDEGAVARSGIARGRDARARVREKEQYTKLARRILQEAQEQQSSRRAEG